MRFTVKQIFLMIDVLMDRRKAKVDFSNEKEAKKHREIVKQIRKVRSYLQ